MPEVRNKKGFTRQSTSPYAKTRGKGANVVRKQSKLKHTRGGTVRLKQRQMDIINGDEDLGEWTLEELVAGMRKGGGRPPVVIPIVVHQELARRVLNDVRHRQVAELGYAVDMHMAIIRGIKLEERKDPLTKKKVWVAPEPTMVQLKAVLALQDRVQGSPKEEIDVNIAVEKPYEKMLASAIVANAEQLKEAEEKEDAEVVEGEIVEEEDGDD